jgi:hypothetical protein
MNSICKEQDSEDGSERELPAGFEQLGWSY